MSQRRSRSRRSVESDDEFEASTESKSKSSLSDVERERLVGDLMRFVLFSDLHKHTVTKQNISQKVLKDYAGKRNVSNDIIAEAQLRFKNIFGYEWQELPKTKTQLTGKVKKKVIDSSGKSGKFILVNKLADTENLLTWDPQGPVMGLLMVVLSIIHLNNNAVEQETLYQLLTHVGLDERDVCDDLPNWTELIEKTFVRQLYLEKEKLRERVNSNGGDVYEYRIGQRSKLEVPTVHIMKFIAEVFGEKLSDIQLKEAENEMDEEMDQNSD